MHRRGSGTVARSNLSGLGSRIQLELAKCREFRPGAVATIKTHVNSLFRKLGVQNRVQAVVLAHETGVVRPGRLA